MVLSRGMSGLISGLRILFLVVLALGCKKEESVIVANYLFATPHDITMTQGSDTTVLLSGGVRPYTILQSPKANIADVQLHGDTLLIHAALSTGSDHIKAGDAAPSQNTVVIPLIVMTNSSHSFTNHR